MRAASSALEALLMYSFYVRLAPSRPKSIRKMVIGDEGESKHDESRKDNRDTRERGRTGLE